MITDHITNYKKILLNNFSDIDGQTILDYGCGTGDFIEIMLSKSLPKKIIAIDSSEEMMSSVSDRFKSHIEDGIVVPVIAHDPSSVMNETIDKIICHNVLECVKDKIGFINSLRNILKKDAGLLLLSHHDFDSAMYNSEYKQLSRDLIHHFSDTQQDWQENVDGQMGRKIPGIITKSDFGNNFKSTTWRIVEREFSEGCYGHMMAKMLMSVGAGTFDASKMQDWHNDLVSKSKSGEYYFAIDLVYCLCAR